jgi:hypothetical protein
VHGCGTSLDGSGESSVACAVGSVARHREYPHARDRCRTTVPPDCQVTCRKTSKSGKSGLSPPGDCRAGLSEVDPSPTVWRGEGPETALPRTLARITRARSPSPEREVRDADLLYLLALACLPPQSMIVEAWRSRRGRHAFTHCRASGPGPAVPASRSAAGGAIPGRAARGHRAAGWPAPRLRT